SGQANIIGIVMCKTLLGRVEGTCITCAKFEKVMHQYSTILSIQELVHDILINLKKIVFKSNKVIVRDIIATLTKAIHLDIKLKVEKDSGYCKYFFIEIWTNGSVIPKEALYEASQSLIDLFIPFLHAEKEEVMHGLGNKNQSNMLHFSSPPSKDRMKKEMTFKHIFIDQLELPAKAYNCPKRVDDDLMKIKKFEKNLLNKY
ncbi:hypothetical protein CY35_02G060000, partial [Sphagnum magellanicum]